MFYSKSIVDLVSMIDKTHSGTLFPLSMEEFPFEVKRMFWITSVPIAGMRGGHAHIKCKQIYLCVKGCILVECDDGKNRHSFAIKEGQGALIDNLVWTRETFLTGEDILFVFCSEEYDTKDYLNTVERLKEYNDNISKPQS